MAIYTLKYINEAYKSKYASYFNDNRDDDDEDEDEDDDKPSNKKEDSTPIKPLTHLSSQNLYRLTDIAKSTLRQFPKLRKCCDFVDLSDKCEIDDDGRRVSALDLYRQKSGTSFIKTIEGDVWSGYPNFKDGGSDDYENDKKEFIKAVNDKIKSMGMNAKFTSSSDNDEAVSFGFRSYSTR